MKKNYRIEKMDGSKKGDRWFFMRSRPGARIDKFYSEDFSLILNDIKNITPNLYDNFKKYFTNFYHYLEEDNLTITTYNHGDFHDFNFSLNGLFWDIDTFDYNPLLNDFAVYYWHFYAKEGYLIYKYSPWLTYYMFNDLDKEELKKVRKLKQNVIYRWYDEIEKAFSKHNIQNQIFNEFLYKLFCRVFLIDNVLNYDVNDRIKIYNFFNYFLTNEDKNIKELLFSNPEIFIK